MKSRRPDSIPCPDAFDPALTRRMIQDPALRERLHNAIGDAAERVRARNLRRWCASDDASFPRRAAALAEATEEVAILCRALGSLCEIPAGEIDSAARVFRDPEDFW